MIKVLGAVLIVCGGTLLGVSHCNELKRHLRLLEDLDMALGLMGGEICEMLSPLPLVFRDLSRRGPKGVREFFWEIRAEGDKPLAEEWMLAVSKLEISAEDKEQLAGLANVLGRCEAGLQETEIRRVKGKLAFSADKLRGEINSRGRSYAGLGASFGAILALILL